MADLDIIKDLEKELGFKLQSINTEARDSLFEFTRINEDVLKKHSKSYFLSGGYNDEEATVTTLIIHNCNLSEIPSMVFQLKNLKKLVISDNNIRIIPRAILRLVNLTHFNIENNRIDTLPDELFNFGSVMRGQARQYYFNFSNNRINKIPKIFNTDKTYLVTVESDIERAEAEFQDPVIYIMDNKSLKYPSYSVLKVDKEDAVFRFYEIQKRKTPNTVFNNEKRVFQYGVKNFYIDNYQNLKNVSVKDIPIDTQWVFITGENGHGKTSLLQAIVIGLNGNKDKNFLLNENNSLKNSYIEYKYKEDSIVNIIGENYEIKYHVQHKKSEVKTYYIQDNNYIVKFDNFAAYGTSRLNKNINPNNKNRTYSLFNTDGVLLDIENELIQWKGLKKTRFERAIDILKKLMAPYVEEIIVNPENSKLIVEYKESGYSDLKTFKELASGFKSIVAMVGDMIIRLSENQPEVTNFNELAGIVLIDEFDLHLHPKMQRKLVERLTNVFPKVQFIVSTHSPIPLLGAPKNSVILKVNRTKEEGITVEKLDINLSELPAKNILSSPIFDFQDVIPKTYEKGMRLRTEKNYDEVVFYKILEEKMQAIANEAGVEYKTIKKTLPQANKYSF